MFAAQKAFHFGEYQVDLVEGQLYKAGIRIKLREKSFRVLAALLDHPGQIVTREELRRQLWPDGTFVDFDTSLNTTMARLREALGDSADHPRFIETLPKHGYRFLVDVLETPRAPHIGPSSRVNVVVLPFLNVTGDLAQEYFGDALTGEVITELAALAPDRLGVIARTTAMHYKGSHKDVSRIGHELGVDYVVEGGVHRAGDRIAVNVRLVRVKDQTHIWAQRNDAELNDTLKSVAGIAQAIAAKVGIEQIEAKVHSSEVCA